ncbi:MAG: YhjD/YihY/BrkB family envelope integrity protein [Planctomycetota bacterium]
MKLFDYIGEKVKEYTKAAILFIYRFISSNLKIIYMAGNEFSKDYCIIRAAALSFVTALALVPAGIVFLLFGKWTGLLAMSDIAQWVRTFLASRFLPPSGAEETITHLNNIVDSYINKVSMQVSGISIISISALIITTMLFLLTIEKSFNDIWAVSVKRSVVKKVRNVWILITLGPILVFFSFFFGARLYSDVMQEVSKHSTLFTISTFILPFIFSIFVFYLLYQFVPYTAVKVSSALKGAVIAGIIWEFIKLPFTHYVTNILNLEQVYGQIGFIPIFLLWLYLTWGIVLLGAEISFTQQNILILENQDPKERKFAAGLREYFSVRIAEQVAQTFRNGNGAAKVSDIAKALNISRSFVIEISEKMRKKKIFLSLKEKTAYQLAIPEEKVTLGDIITTVTPTLFNIPEQTQDALDMHLRELFSMTHKFINENLYHITLADVMKIRESKRK